MTNRKLHQLTGTIQACWPGQVTTKNQYQNQPLYCLEILTQSLFFHTKKETLYVFPNLVSLEIWKVLTTKSYLKKVYLFFYEKRVRGWRLKDWEEITESN